MATDREARNGNSLIRILVVLAGLLFVAVFLRRLVTQPIVGDAALVAGIFVGAIVTIGAIAYVYFDRASEHKSED